VSVKATQAKAKEAELTEGTEAAEDHKAFALEASDGDL
jgi:hypothetical protein